MPAGLGGICPSQCLYFTARKNFKKEEAPQQEEEDAEVENEKEAEAEEEEGEAASFFSSLAASASALALTSALTSTSDSLRRRLAAVSCLAGGDSLVAGSEP